MLEIFGKVRRISKRIIEAFFNKSSNVSGVASDSIKVAGETVPLNGLHNIGIACVQSWGDSCSSVG
jgi:hypothetical protein